MIATIWKQLGLCALFCWGGLLRAEDLLVVRLGEGDSAALIAERHFGGTDNLKELLAYNGLPEDAVLTVGARLIVPLHVRQTALRQLSEAERALAVAQDELADQYAPALYESAALAYRQAVEFRRALDYARSAGMARLCVLRSEDAVGAAQQNARIRQSITLASSHGPVYLSGPGNDWVAIGTNTAIEVGGRLRTGEAARAELLLPDGSRVRVLDQSVVGVEELLLDRRTAVRHSALRLERGRIEASIPPPNPSVSTFVLRTPNSDVHLGGSDLLAQAPQDDLTRLSLVGGTARCVARDQTVVLAAGQGTFVRGNRPPERPQALPSPPLLAGPEILATPLQAIDLAWSQRETRDLTAFHWEIAADADFLNPLASRALPLGTGARTPVLPEGDYHWRVASIGRDGLPGPWSRAHQINVRKAMAVALVPESKVWEHERQAYVAGGNRFAIEAADSPSSVRETEYRLNGGAFIRAPGFSLGRSGIYEIDIRGIAADGEPGPLSTHLFVADVDAPALQVRRADAPAPDGPEWVDIHVEATDDVGVARIQFRVNDGPWMQYLNPFRISRAQPVRVEVQAIDIFGNRSPLERLDLKP